MEIMITAETTPNEALNLSQLSWSIFSRFGINEHGTIPIEQEVGGQNIDTNFLIDVLNYFDQDESLSSTVFTKYSVPVLIDYLEKSHRYYLDKKLPEIEQTINILLSLDGVNSSKLNILQVMFYGYQKELKEHIYIEEELLFPYAEVLYQSVKRKNGVLFALIHHNQFSIDDYIGQHQDSHDKLHSLYKLMRSITPLVTNQTPYRILLGQLNNLENDLKFHALIEDNVLVPKLKCSEEELTSTSSIE